MARKLLLLAGAAVLITAAPAHAIAPTYEPSCAKPGAQVTVRNVFSSTPANSYVTAETRSVADVWKGDDGVVSTGTEVKGPRGPVSNAPDPNFETYTIPTFVQTITMPPVKVIGGLPVVGYRMSISPYGKDETEYSNADTYGDMFPDIKALYLAQKSIKAGRNQRVAYLVRGFRKAQPYAHAIGPGKTKHIKLGRGQGDDTCGRSGGLLRLAGLKPGSYRVVVNTSRRSTSAAGGAVTSLRITR